MAFNVEREDQLEGSWCAELGTFVGLTHDEIEGPIVWYHDERKSTRAMSFAELLERVTTQ